MSIDVELVIINKKKRVEMNKDNEIRFTTHDRLMRAWENSMELTRDFETYSKEIDNNNIKKVFSDFAIEEGVHVSKLREILISNQSSAI